MDPKESLSLSIVVPVFNEEKNLPDLYKEITKSSKELNLSYGIIFVPPSSRPVGFAPQIGDHGSEPDPVGVRPHSTKSFSDERVAEARRVWSKAYGRVISEEEAIEILTNVRRLAEILLHAEEKKEER